MPKDARPEGTVGPAADPRVGSEGRSAPGRPTPDRTAHRLWLLGLVPGGAWGRWVSGLTIFASLAALFFGLGGLAGGPGAGRVGAGVALFFCVILGYIVPIHHLIIERFATALARLTSELDVSPERLARWRRRIDHKPAAWLFTTLGLGTIAGCAHNLLLIDATRLVAALSYLPSLLTIIATMLIWIVMTSVIASLLDCALLFRSAAHRVRIRLLDTRPLTPFGSVAVSSTLAMIGAQAAFPVMLFASEVDYLSYVPGLVATGIPMLFFFLLPVWPLHRRIAAAKRDALDDVARQIALLPTPTNAEQFQQIGAVLTYRREIASASEWPFDNSIMGRLSLYLVIPPLTWVGAALIEMLLDAIL